MEVHGSSSIYRRQRDSQRSAFPNLRRHSLRDDQSAIERGEQIEQFALKKVLQR